MARTSRAPALPVQSSRQSAAKSKLFRGTEPRRPTVADVIDPSQRSKVPSALTRFALFMAKRVSDQGNGSSSRSTSHESLAMPLIPSRKGTALGHKTKGTRREESS